MTITDDDLGGMVQFSAPTYSVNEDGGDASRHGRAHRRPGRRSVGAAADGRSLRRGARPTTPRPPTAADYTSTDVRVTFGPGETTKTVRIPITADAAAEGIETFYVQLSDPQPSGTPRHAHDRPVALATVSIVDAQATVQFGQATFTVAEGQPVATVTVQRTAPAGRLTVDYATSDGTATAPGRLPEHRRHADLRAGVTSQSFTVRLVDNQVVDGRQERSP